VNSENGTGGFKDRLAERIGDQEPFKWARQAGVPTSTFDRIWNHGQIPRAETAAKIAAALGVSLDWLLSGAGDQTSASQRPPSEQPRRHPAELPIDEKFMARVGVAVAQAYREAGQPFTEAQYAVEIHRMLSAILADAQASDEYEALLEIQKSRIKRRLADARANPGTGKASA